MADHQPLVAMFRPNKPTPALAANRLSRWALFLRQFNYTIEYRKTSEHSNTDGCPQSTVRRIRSRFRHGRKYRWLGHRLYHRNTEFASETNRRRFVAEGVSSGSNSDEGHAIHERRLAREERWRWSSRDVPQNRCLSVCQDCLLYGARVVIPTKLQQQVLDLLHECHFGIQGMKQLARTPVYWPNIDSDILDLPAMSELRRTSVRTVESDRSSLDVTWEAVEPSSSVMESQNLVSVSRRVSSLETRFLESRLGLGLEGFWSRSRALRLETLHRLFFMKFCKKEFP